jgi:hypothetical protein
LADDSKYSKESYGTKSDGYSAERKDMYESDAKMLAGKEKREMVGFCPARCAAPD